MSERPGYLILVVHPDQASIDLWSAHYTEADAKVMFDRLTILLGATRSTVRLIEVPETEGMVASTGTMAAVAPTPAKPAAPPPAPAEPPVPFRRQSRESFQAETEAMMLDAAHGIARDADAPLAEGGAFS